MSASRDARVYAWYERIVSRPPDAWPEAVRQTDLGDESLQELVRLLDAYNDSLGAASAGLARTVREAVGHDDIVGATLGAYRVLECLSRAGGMGTLYRAERADGSYSRPVAIKVVRLGLDTERFIRRFDAERHILARLEHPGIVSLIDAGATPSGRPYFVMELIDGGLPIDEYCRLKGLPLSERLDLFLQVCRAVSYAHARLVVHRDLKPANILVTPDARVKLLDFGLAKLLSDDTGPFIPDTTMPGERFLTPEYASPEQVRGEPAFLASDVYSLGVVLYELLTDTRPYTFSSRTEPEITRLVCDVEPPKPSTAVRSVSPRTATAGHTASSTVGDAGQLSRALRGDLDAIVMKSLRKDAQDRYPSVAAFEADIERHSKGRPVEARAGTRTYLATRFVKRHRLALAAGVLVFLSLFGGILATWRQASVAETARRDAETQRAAAQRRFEDVRSIATSFIFDVHDAIANLPGATPAREMVVSKGLSYLDALAKDSAGDESLRLELAEAYLRMGAIQGAPFASNVGNVAAGLESLEKALRLVESTSSADTRTRSAYARSLEGLAEALFANGRGVEAVAHLRKAIATRASLLGDDPANLAHLDGLARSHARLCVLLVPTGDLEGAISACVNARSAFDRLLVAKPDDRSLARAAALSDSAHGNALRLSRKPADAREPLARSMNRLRTLVATDHTDATSQQNLATVLIQAASNHAALGEWGPAADSYEEAVAALDALRTLDPRNERLRAVLSFVLLRRSPSLLQARRHEAAVASTKRGLDMMAAQATRPGAGPTDKNDYASWLMTCVPESLRNPELALRFAQQAVASAPDSAVYLDTLALAYFNTGSHARAIETGEKALANLAATGSGGPAAGLRAEIEQHLAMFRAGQ